MAYREYVEKGYMPSREMMKKFLIEQIDFKRNFEVVDLYNAVDKVSAEDVKAKVVLPKLPVSKMDGIGVCFADFKNGIPDTKNWQEGKGYIFANTGCVVPEPYDTVILIEDVRFIDGKLKILAKPETKGQLIDPPGSLIGKDEVLVNKYEKITAPQVGLLASGGIKEVKVIARPKIAFIPTGDELVSWQSEDYPVYKNIESNSMMLSAFCKQYQADLTIFPIIPDDKEKIKEALTKASEIADIILINAGSSKGTKDFTLDLLETEGEVLVYELGCRPGKHSSFSKFNQKPVLGIAGPPNGAELAMRFYLKAIMQAYYHQKLSSLETVNVIVDFDFTAPKNADFCLQVHIFKQDDKYHAQIINPKGVTRATLLQKYNGFIYQLKGTSLNVGDEVTAELIVERKEIENQN
ncbi:molybdopterin molybdotransferase MoeA [Megamonas sp.]|jgi:molybdopterin molybdotransferase|uniref:molybdopterin molybdotransferase MoeA n=1 Tax=Megamonas sp. TaxID=2049033 RepID=UPI00258D1F8F|nr:molybdopterin molybdotransferase MoeA [Megamonas sp.]